MSTSYDEVMQSLGLEPSSKRQGRKGTPTCGTYSGYMACRRQPGGACAPCLAAKAEYSRTWYEANRDRVNSRRRKGGDQR